MVASRLFQRTPDHFMTVFKLIRTFAFILAFAPYLLLADKKETKKKPLKINGVSSIPWRSVGPALMSGRIADLAIDPENPNVWYVAAGSGGVWKTTNAGTNDDRMRSALVFRH